MKKAWFMALLSAVVAIGLSADPADAKRLGGGKSIGMQRQAPAQAAPQSPPPQTPAAPQAAPNAAKQATPGAAATAAAQPAKRSWMGPLAGLAAGLGLAALAHSLGFGEGLANLMMILLLGLVAVVAVRFVMSRLAAGRQPSLAGAGAGATGGAAPWADATPMPTRAQPASQHFEAAPAAASATSVTGTPLRPINIGENLVPAAAIGSTALALPADFDRPGFERAAQMIFIRMQTAHDTADLDDLRQFTTPEFFAAVRLDIQDRGGVAQATDVERVNAQLVDFGEDGNRQIASVRFTGRIREDAQSLAQPFDEIWHLVKPLDGSRPWAIAGIQQSA